jgi:hypothetical protein
MPESKFKILTPDEINELNREGFDLNVKKFYALSFLINDEQNHAADPRSFKIATSFVEPLTKTGMGRPWIPDTLPDGKHIRPKKGATAEEILQFQKDFAGGIMRGYWVNPISLNSNVIIEIFPEFKKAVEDGDIPPFVSPMLGNWTEDKNGEVITGEILHLQSVGTPGYDPEIAKFMGTCEGDFNECAIQLEPLAAAGKLKEYRNSSISCPKKFLNTLAASGIQMSLDHSQPPTEPEPKPEENKGGTSEGEAKILAAVEEIKTTTETLKEAIVEVATGAAGVDENAIREKMGMGAMADHPENPEEKEKEKTLAAAGAKQELESVTIAKKALKELDILKKERADEKDILTQKERERQVKIIVKSKLLSKEVKIEDKDSYTKELLEKKSSTKPEELADLSLLAEDAEKRIISLIPEDETLGAAGLYDDYPIPESTESTVDYASIENSITEDNY